MQLIDLQGLGLLLQNTGSDTVSVDGSRQASRSHRTSNFARSGLLAESQRWPATGSSPPFRLLKCLSKSDGRSLRMTFSGVPNSAALEYVSFLVFRLSRRVSCRQRISVVGRSYLADIPSSKEGPILRKLVQLGLLHEYMVTNRTRVTLLS